MNKTGHATYEFGFGGFSSTLKVLYVTDELMITYECFGVNTLDGYCPQENEEIQVKIFENRFSY